MRKSQEFRRLEMFFFQAVIYLCGVVVGDCVYRLWIHKQHMCKPLAIVLKMAVWPIISISVFKHEPDDAMFYLKLGMYHPGGILYLSNTFLVCTGPYVSCLRFSE